jgi:hypothetical protein
MFVSPRPLYVALLLPLCLAACGSDATTEPQPLVRQVTAECTLTFSAPPSVPPPPTFTQTDTGSCVFSRLGPLAFTGELEINTAALTQRGSRTFTARDGSAFRAVVEGTSTPRPPGLLDFVATLRVTGGTGRFTSVSGSLEGRGTANQQTRTTTVTFTGTLTYLPIAEDGA